jgi:hypothetical protein
MRDMDEQTPKLQWTLVESINDRGDPMGHFYASRVQGGWVLWNVKNHTMCFVPRQPTHAGERRG